MGQSGTIWGIGGGRRIGTRVDVYESIDSTNSRALALADDPANDGLVILAGAQTAGRGQYGRTWTALPGSSVLLSALVFPPMELRRPALLTAWAAVSVCSVVRELIGQPVRIKWPNDILAHGKKLCGILIEQRACADGRLATVVGIGLNVTQPAAWFRDVGLPDAVSLACLREHPLETRAVAHRLLRELDEQYDSLLGGDLLGGGLPSLEAAWIWHLGLLGKDVRIERHGAADCRGLVRNLTFAALELELPDGAFLGLAPETIRQVSVTARI